MGEITIGVVSGLVGLLLGLATFGATQLRQRRETLDKRIEREVEAQLGKRYVDFLSAGQETNTSLREASESIRAEAGKIMHEAREHLQQLTNATATRDALEESLAQATAIIPNLSVVRSATPASLTSMLRRSTTHAETFGLIEQIRVHPATRSRQFELAGDAARSRLEDLVLARELYSLAVENDPENQSARAELIALDLESNEKSLARHAEETLLDMVREHGPQRNAATILFNYYIRFEEYEKMTVACESLLETYPEAPSLYRNLAIAQSESGAPRDSVVASFEKALSLADCIDSITQYVNISKTYSPWLCRKGRPERAKEILDRALMLSPTEPEVYAALTTYALCVDDLDLAERAARLAVVNGRPGGEQLGEDQSRAVFSLRFLKGLDQEEGPGTSAA